MNIKEQVKEILLGLIGEVKNEVNLEATQEAETETTQEAQVELATMALADGTTIEAESFEAGQSVVVVTAEGERVPLPVGEYQLENGMMLVVETEGTIASISDAEAEVEVEVETEMSKELEAIKAENAELKAKLDALELAKTELTSKLDETVEKLVELSAMPADSGIKPNPKGNESRKSEPVNLGKMTIQERINYFKNFNQ